MAPIGGSKGIEDAARAYGIDRLSRPRKGDSTEAPGGAGESPSDAVSLSDQAKSLAAARKAVHEAPEVRQEKVEAIRQAIADGTYQVSARELARKLIDTGVV